MNCILPDEAGLLRGYRALESPTMPCSAQAQVCDLPNGGESVQPRSPRRTAPSEMGTQMRYATGEKGHGGALEGASARHDAKNAEAPSDRSGGAS